MRHYIVFLDKDRVPGEARIPDFEHVWVEYPDTPPEDGAHHLWRASVAVTHSVPISAALIDACARLGLIVMMGPEAGVVDAAACAARGIDLVHLPSEAGVEDGGAARMARLMAVIDAHVAGLQAAAGG